ncbi:uncharacterized protein J7T54_004209 [Emericellopsis cladophorae]|uniref:Large ribosomal subunit protein mL38 n=1 Tax=Emericellopsis cladophorae TaxID=2686198 RepID=A0A9Q0BBS8_9HYPO|nr:uncharacterized protein J7T54_004209 [Emericellopsis cladophorae]KAI6780077.1 hypothetical protein J7T54_004209 [Emericellopsis cladophorae]
MSRCQSVARPLARQLSRQLYRPFSTTPSISAEVTTEPPATTPSPADLDPDTVLPEFENALMKAGQMPIGSRRRRMAIRDYPDGVPFEQLPYQAFQEARKILAADREQKLAAIRAELAKIALLESRDAKDFKGGQAMKDTRIASLKRYVEVLKIQADVNDPVVKKRFEDGLGDMNKPIYRYYAERRWRSYQHKLITQRIEQFNIVPDILPKLEPTADVQLYFWQQKTQPGAIIDSLVSEPPPRLNVQVFDKGERLVTIVVLDADVPNVEADGYTKKCHFVAANIPLSPTQPSIPLGKIKDENQLAVPWLPPTSQKGSPYHRIAIFVLEQDGPLDAKALKEQYANRLGKDKTSFSLKSIRDKYNLKPFGFSIFRSVWDDNTAAVMGRHGIEGADIEFRPTRVHSMKQPVKARGWEAKRQGPKYRHLWKYTKRIKGVSNGRKWLKAGKR